MHSTASIDSYARVVWEYMAMSEPLRPADAIFVMCSNDTRVADYAAELYGRGLAPYIIFSGGIGRMTEGVFHRPEARVFADVAIRHGVPEDRILIEDASTNSGENVLFTKEMLRKSGFDFHTLLLAQKPYMMRRAFATVRKRWPEVELIPTTPDISFDAYPTPDIDKEFLIHALVGDMQRIKEYPALGFQIPLEIPQEVWRAYEALVAAGYTKFLIPA